MKVKRVMLLVVTGITVSIVCFLLGRYSHRSSMIFRDPAEDVDISRQVDRFERLVDRINSYVREHDGEIPPDPYRSFVESGTVESFLDFIYADTVVHFDVLTLPPKISKDLHENARAPFYWLTLSEIGEIWVCYLDGTWEREVRRGISDPSRLSRFGESQSTWVKNFHDVGYPYWISIKEKADWSRKELRRLRWDGERRMYVP